MLSELFDIKMKLLLTFEERLPTGLFSQITRGAKLLEDGCMVAPSGSLSAVFYLPFLGYNVLSEMGSCRHVGK